jgi:hypothetical protein
MLLRKAGTRLGAPLRALATEPLGNSLSDGVYGAPPALGGAEHRGAGADGGRPLAADPRVKAARAAQGRRGRDRDDMNAPLHDSMSDGDHAYAARRARALRSSLSDPADAWLGSSLADGSYELPAALRGAPAGAARARQGLRVPARPAMFMQRVPARRGGPDPLHNSLSAGDYVPRER